MEALLNRKFVLLNLITVAVSALMVCSVAFLNEFPLVYTDTGTYIHNGFRGDVPYDRPIFYGLFIKHTSYGFSLWLTILAQSVILSWLLFESFKLLYKGPHLRPMFVAIVGLITLTTGISFNASILIPDVFTPICMLSTFLLFYKKDHEKWKKWALIIVLSYSLSVHLSHMLILSTSVFGYILIQSFIRKSTLQIGFTQFKTILLTLLVTIILIPCANYALDRKFQLSGGGPVFILNHLREVGLLTEFLSQNCEDSDYKLCNYQSELDNSEFLWDTSSPLYITGGWEKNKEEYNSIIWSIVSNPYYYPKLLITAFEFSYRQLLEFHSTVDIPQRENSAPYGPIYWRFNDSVRNYLASKQNTEGYTLKTFNSIEYIVVLVSIILILALLFTGKISNSSFLIWVILIVLASAIICSNFSTVNARYMNRVIWLLPFVGLTSLFNLFFNRTSDI